MRGTPWTGPNHQPTFQLGWMIRSYFPVLKNAPKRDACMFWMNLRLKLSYMRVKKGQERVHFDNEKMFGRRTECQRGFQSDTTPVFLLQIWTSFSLLISYIMVCPVKGTNKVTKEFCPSQQAYQQHRRREKSIWNSYNEWLQHPDLFEKFLINSWVHCVKLSSYSVHLVVI